MATTDTAARNQIWSQIDRQVMSDAVILPGLYAKSLLYRNPERNVIVKHGLRAALTPIVTIFGLDLGRPGRASHLLWTVTTR